MKLTMLGTGNAMVTECYNTCFVLSENNRHFLVDGGGGNTLLRQLKYGGFDWKDIREIFVTHKHVDHIMGIIWMIRMICQHMNQDQYEGEAVIYAHEEVIQILSSMASMLFKSSETRFIGTRLHFISVTDGEERTVLGHKTVFFDIQSTKAKQYGFTMYLNQTDKLTCCGDEPYKDVEEPYPKGSKWLMHEAFCLFSQAERSRPYEKHHSTVKDACLLADQLQVKNLILYHTEDKNIENRRELYLEEGRQYYTGNLYIPNDLEILEL